MWVYLYGHHTFKEKWLQRNVYQITEHIDKAEVIIVLGGDGTMLKAVKQLGQYNKPFYGVHYGHRGFLMNPVDQNSPWETVHTWRINRLSVVLHNALNKSNLTYAINDVILRRKIGQAVHIRAQLWKKHVLLYKGDGVVISTGLGNFGYNWSVKGPISDEHLSTITLTPLYDHKLVNSLIVPQKDLDISLYMEAADTRPVTVEIDGQVWSDIKQVDIVCKTQITLLHHKAMRDHIMHTLAHYHNLN